MVRRSAGRGRVLVGQGDLHENRPAQLVASQSCALLLYWNLVKRRSTKPTCDMERCKACGKGVSVSSSRRTLGADSRNTLLSISRSIDFLRLQRHFGSGYLCTKYFWLAERCGRLKSELANVEELLKGKLQFVCANHVGEISRATKRPSSGEAIPRKKSRVETSEGALMVNAR